MVIQDDSDTPVEVSVMKTLKTPHLENKKYVIVKNHVRELPISKRADSEHSSTQEDSTESESSAKKVKKSSKKESKVIETESQLNPPKTKCKDVSKELRDIKKELQDLRKELHECFNRLEAKIDNIVQSIDSGPSSQSNNLKESISEEECHCKVNTKIIFDEDGQQSVTEPIIESHICLKKLKRKYSDVAKNIDIHQIAMAQKALDTRNVAVEYEEQNVALPEDLVSLSNILQDSDIGISYRNKVIDKVKLLKQEHLNEIKFNRLSMIEKLKSNSNSIEIFEFNGANLFSLPGYPDWK